MGVSHPGIAVAVVGLVLTAGCGGLLPASGESTETVTPVPVPEPTATASPVPDTATRTARAGETTSTGVARRSEVGQPRYVSLRPTCERPPGAVVAIQVGALMNNDPKTNAGIRTTWEFAAPSNRRITGPYPNFVNIIQQGFEPLLDASTVTTAGGEQTAYRWRLERQTEPPNAGCWMTVGVAPA